MKKHLHNLNFAVCGILMLCISTALSAQCPTGIVSYWDLNETSGSAYVDAVSGHDANVQNAPSNITGIIGNAKYFDGTKRLSVAAHTDFDFSNTTSFSIEVWARFTDITFGTYNKIMIGRVGATVATGVQWWIGSAQTSGTLTFFIRDANDVSYSVTTNKINDGAWHHVVAVRNADDNTIKIYVDGTLKSSAPATFTGSFASSSPLQIGYLNRNGAPEYWYKGDLDDIAIYNKALTAAEILDHRSKGILGIGYCDGYAPKIKSTPSLTAAVGQTYIYDVNASGMAPITYALTKAPTGMTINSSSGIITWTPTSTNQDGTVTVTASNTNYPPADVQTFVISIAEAPVCPNGLLGLWKLNEASGPVYTDQYGNHAIASVSPSAATGIVNGAQTFSSTSLVSIPDNGEFEWPATQNFTLEAWFKTSNTSNSDNLVILGRLRKDTYYTNWWIGIDGSERPVFYASDALGTDAQITGTTSLADGNWHHIVGVRNESVNKNFLYVDGNMIGEASVNYLNSFTVDANDSVPVNLGWFNSGSLHHFTGEIDEVAIFTVALTPEQITQFYNAKSPTGHCAPGNFGPVFKSQPVIAATQGTLYSYSIVTDDYDVSDALVLSAPTKPAWLTLNWTAGQRTATLSGTPADGDVGNANVTLRVSDGSINKDQTFTISVANINDAPVITSTAVVTVDEGVLYSYTVIATDADDDALTFAATSKPEWLSINATTGVLSGTPPHSSVGDHDIVVTASDGTATTSQSFTLTVNSVNVAPIITGQVPLTAYKNTPLLLALSNFTVTDPDNTYPGDFTLTVLDGTNYSVEGTTITPDLDYVGNINVGVQVNDGIVSSGIYYALIEVIIGTGISDNEKEKYLSVYPVPASDRIHFEFKNEFNPTSIEIWSLSGALVKQITVDEPAETIMVDELNAGTYLYKVVSGRDIINGTFIVVKQ